MTIEQIIEEQLKKNPNMVSKSGAWGGLTNEHLASMLKEKQVMQEELEATKRKVQELEEEAKTTPKELVVIRHDPQNPEGKVEEKIGPQHERFAELVKLIQINVPVYIWGPTGSGKTTAVENAAKILGLRFFRKVVSSQSSEGTLFGFHNGTGYVEGIAYEPYKNGGVLLIDEIDNGNPNINIVIKMLADGDSCNFPCGRVEKHSDFRLIANANTIGNGANRQYVGRSVQDAALLNIFGFLNWEYDGEFETILCFNEYNKWQGKVKKDLINLIATCWSYRDAIDAVGIKHIISPRNLINATRMLAQSFPREFILEATILRGLDDTQSTKIMQEARQHFQKNVKKLRKYGDESGEQKQLLPSSEQATAYEEVMKEYQQAKAGQAKSLGDLKDIFVKNIIKDETEEGDAF